MEDNPFDKNMDMTEKILEELRLFHGRPQVMEYRDIEEQYRGQLDSHLVRPDADYGEMRPTMLYQGIPCFPRQDLVAITGKAKCGKTWATSILMAAAMWGGEILGMEAAEGLLKVLYVDTEQAAYSTQKVLQRVLKMSTLPYNDERLQMLNLRRETHDLRLQLLLAAMSRMRPDLVIIDGVRDLLLDFNDIEESMTLINRLMKLASDFDCSVVCILHQNKPKDDNNMRGHLGSELENKAAEVYEMTREDGIFRFSQKLSRNQPLEHDLRFVIEGESPSSPSPSLPKGEGEDNKQTTLLSTPDWTNFNPDFKEILIRSLPPGYTLGYNEVIGNLWKWCKSKNLNAKEIWRVSKDQGFIVSYGKNRYSLAPGAPPLTPLEGILQLPTS